MKTVKTYEEWSLFKKELTPDEEYKKAAKKAQKERVKPKEEKEEKEETPHSNSGNDLYGEESWED